MNEANLAIALEDVIAILTTTKDATVAREMAVAVAREAVAKADHTNILIATLREKMAEHVA